MQYLMTNILLVSYPVWMLYVSLVKALRPVDFWVLNGVLMKGVLRFWRGGVSV